MTKKDEAIKWFTMLREKFTGTEYGEYLDMAIKELSRSENPNKWIPVVRGCPILNTDLAIVVMMASRRMMPLRANDYWYRIFQTSLKK